MMNWSEYEEEKPVKRNVWVELLLALGIAVSLAAIIGPLYGCASPSPRSEVCLLQFLGKTDAGVHLVATTCVTPEAFAESQK